MAQTLNIYSQFLNTIINKEIDLDSDELKVMLVSSGYSPNKNTDKYKNNITSEISGNGYSAGGIVLGNVTYTVENQIATLKADNPRWLELNVNNLRYAVIYDNTPATDDIKPLLAYIDFGESLNIINAELEIIWNTNGIMKFVIS